MIERFEDTINLVEEQLGKDVTPSVNQTKILLECIDTLLIALGVEKRDEGGFTLHVPEGSKIQSVNVVYVDAGGGE